MTTLSRLNRVFALAAILGVMFLSSLVDAWVEGEVHPVDGMSSSDMRLELQRRAKTCNGCTEKRHLRERLIEVWDEPYVFVKSDDDGNKKPEKREEETERMIPPQRHAEKQSDDDSPSSVSEEELLVYDKRYEQRERMRRNMVKAGVGAKIDLSQTKLTLPNQGKIPPHLEPILEKRWKKRQKEKNQKNPKNQKNNKNKKEKQQKQRSVSRDGDDEM
eukprot:PhM_4_TR14545/c0_g2_i1/m.92280